MVSVNGRFHAFDLARQLHHHGNLHRLITTYPRFKAIEWDIPPEKIIALPVLEVMKRVKNYVPLGVKRWVTAAQMLLFDVSAARLVPRDSGLFVGWSGSSLLSLRRCKLLGIPTVLQRGSAHILTQLDLLETEYRTAGVKFHPPHASVVARELAEYEVADFIDVPSAFARRSFVERGVPASKMIVGHLGVDLSRFEPVAKDDDVFRVIFAGGLSLQKGAHYLLQAVFELDLPNLELWHLGSVNAEMHPYLERYRSPRIKLMGHKPQGELYRYYSQGSVFVLPSVHEGFGMVCTQAMSCGLPLICSTNTGGPDIIEDGKEGFVVPIRDVEALKSRIKQLYDHQDQARAMGLAAREKVRHGWSWDDYGDAIAAAYSNAVARHGSDPRVIGSL